jgi:geranylgeranyl reductase
VEEVDFLVIGAGPAGTTAAREAARSGVSTLVLDKDAVVGAKRVCAAGLRPGFCEEFDLPRTLVHCDTPRLALFDASGREHVVRFGPGHTSTREELDGTIAALARAEGASVRTQSLFRSYAFEGDHVIVEYADLRAGVRRSVRARSLFLAQGATAKLEGTAFGDERWAPALMTTLQQRVYLNRPALAVAYETLELHYYPARDGRTVVAWMFPKRDHLAIGLGLMGKLDGRALRAELAAFVERVRARLYPQAEVAGVKEEGHLLFGGWPRARVAQGPVMLGGSAAGLVDATNGEGIFEAAMSGRLAAEAVARRGGAEAIATRYALRLEERFKRRLEHRVRLMRFLERKPRRYGMLFEQLASNSRFSDALQRESHERSTLDRLVLYANALQFGLRASLS